MLGKLDSHQIEDVIGADQKVQPFLLQEEG